MARVNNRPSFIASSRATTAAPPSSNASDEENYDPQRDPRRDKRPVVGGQHPPSRQSLPTPSSEESAPFSTAHKRKRAPGTQAGNGRDDDDQEQEDEEEEEEGEAGEGEDLDDETAGAKRFNRYYDPNQDRKQRQQVKRKMRKLDREVMDNRDDLMRDHDLFMTKLGAVNTVYRHVKQTGDATTDAHIMVNLADVLHKSSTNLVHGDASTGVDLNELIYKCMSYMRNGGPGDSDAATSTQQRRSTQRAADDDDDEDDLQPLDWEFLGANACFPYNSRPACPSFLLGPLSIEKKVRTQTQRRARQIKDMSREARPEALTREAGAVQDENTLTVICGRIHRHMSNHINQAEKALAQMQEDDIPIDQDAFCKEYRITDVGGPGLFDYAINPRCFGETVENFFYISFLIKEGVVGVEVDGNGMPSLSLIQSPDGDKDDAESAAPARLKDAKKHQAVFSIDYETWQKLIEAFDITEPMIKHRGEDTASQVVGGWQP